ncbi:DUF6356 family protein [Minwuia sp.]|uniref:DUF6356 family protein n=1 Tax=Minwuia sp. TaxID=2493630 RepID=UPI003A92A1B1
MNMIERWFVEHPRTVGETYVEHLTHAAWFAGMMAYGAVACLLHALIPGVCERTGSRVIALLHDRMVVNRSAHRARHEPASAAGIPDYQI